MSPSIVAPSSLSWMVLLISAWVVAGCGGALASASPPNGTPQNPPTQVAGADAQDAPAVSAPVRSSAKFTLVNHCPEALVLVAGDPSHPAQTLRTASESETAATIDVPQVLWVTDGEGKGLTSVDLTRHMKKIEVGRSCRTLYAH